MCNHDLPSVSLESETTSPALAGGGGRVGKYVERIPQRDAGKTRAANPQRTKLLGGGTREKRGGKDQFIVSGSTNFETFQLGKRVTQRPAVRSFRPCVFEELFHVHDYGA